jgi:hypothetical protein
MIWVNARDHDQDQPSFSAAARFIPRGHGRIAEHRCVVSEQTTRIAAQ